MSKANGWNTAASVAPSKMDSYNIAPFLECSKKSSLGLTTTASLRQPASETPAIRILSVQRTRSPSTSPASKDGKAIFRTRWPKTCCLKLLVLPWSVSKPGHNISDERMTRCSRLELAVRKANSLAEQIQWRCATEVLFQGSTMGLVTFCRSTPAISSWPLRESSLHGARSRYEIGAAPPIFRTPMRLQLPPMEIIVGQQPRPHLSSPLEGDYQVGGKE